jgi:hypothetical protein
LSPFLPDKLLFSILNAAHPIGAEFQNDIDVLLVFKTGNKLDDVWVLQ